MTALGKFTCGLDAAMAVVDGKWKPLILWELQGGPKRFNVLHRSLTGISQKMLTSTLRELERDGFVARKVFATIPPKVEYTLTELGCDLFVPVKALKRPVTLVRRAFGNPATQPSLFLFR